MEPHNKATIRSIQVNYSLNIHAMAIVLVADEIHNKQSNSSLQDFSKSLNPPKKNKIQDQAAVIDHKDVVKLTQLRNNPFARLSYLHITFCNT